MCSGSEAGSYLRLIDFVYHSTLGLRVIKKQKVQGPHPALLLALARSFPFEGPRPTRPGYDPSVAFASAGLQKSISVKSRGPAKVNICQKSRPTAEKATRHRRARISGRNVTTSNAD